VGVVTVELVVRLWLGLLRWTPQERLAEPLREVAAAVLFPRLGAAPIGAVRHRDLRRLFVGLEAAGVSIEDQIHVRAILVEAFDLAVVYGWCQRNVAVRIGPP
jgi:hypothetical protein